MNQNSKSLKKTIYQNERANTCFEESNCSDTEKAFKLRMSNINLIKQNTSPMSLNSSFLNLMLDDEKKTNNTINRKNYIIKDPILTLSIFDQNQWEYSYFFTEFLETTEKLPHLFSNSEWTNFQDFRNYSEEPILTDGIELRNVMIKSIFPIGYPIEGVEIDLHICIKGEGLFWLFTRCILDKTINDYIYNKDSTVIEISKMKNSSKSMVSFGTFLGTTGKENGILNYKPFFKRQLINYNSSKDKTYIENDYCEYKISIIDQGNEKIQAEILLNDSHKPNNISANFYYPANQNMYLMIAGGGDSVKVKQMICNKFKNDSFQTIDCMIFINNEKKKCSCCILI